MLLHRTSLAEGAQCPPQKSALWPVGLHLTLRAKACILVGGCSTAGSFPEPGVPEDTVHHWGMQHMAAYLTDQRTSDFCTTSLPIEPSLTWRELTALPRLGDLVQQVAQFLDGVPYIPGFSYNMQPE